MNVYLTCLLCLLSWGVGGVILSTLIEFPKTKFSILWKTVICGPVIWLLMALLLLTEGLAEMTREAEEDETIEK